MICNIFRRPKGKEGIAIQFQMLFTVQLFTGITKPHYIIANILGFLFMCLFLSVCFNSVKGLWSSTSPLTGFFWLLSHVIYLKLRKVFFFNFTKVQFLNDKIYSYTKKTIWHLAIWQNWCFGQFYHLKFSFGKEDTLIILLSAWDRSHDSTAKRNLSKDM